MKAVDPDLHWTEHYVTYGFAVIERVVDEAFTDMAMGEVYRALDTDLPPREWTADSPCHGHFPSSQHELGALHTVYDQPGIRDMIDCMFGGSDCWNGERAFQLFITAYNANVEAKLAPVGHLDFVNCFVPILGSGFMFQVALADSEPFSGNITVYPGSHKTVQKALMDDPNALFPADLEPMLATEPFEFVANAGDVLLFHHLVGHSGNSNHAANRTPRISLHCQAAQEHWLDAIDPATATSPWALSLAQNGPYRTVWNEETVRTQSVDERRQRTGADGAKAALASV